MRMTVCTHEKKSACTCVHLHTPIHTPGNTRWNRNFDRKIGGVIRVWAGIGVRKCVTFSWRHRTPCKSHRRPIPGSCGAHMRERVRWRWASSTASSNPCPVGTNTDMHSHTIFLFREALTEGRDSCCYTYTAAHTNRSKYVYMLPKTFSEI